MNSIEGIYPEQRDRDIAKALDTLRRSMLDTCINCEFWLPEQELCGNWHVRPPARVIAGYDRCPAHCFIPF